MKFRRSGALLILAGLWAAGIVLGMRLISGYSQIPGDSGSAPVRWPAGTALSAGRNRPTLVMLIHPRCACSRASLAELSALLDRMPDRVDAHILFWTPGSHDAKWKKTELWQFASEIKRASLHRDVGGREARVFGLATSGHVLLFSPAGQILFSGGITRGRGEYGSSFGMDSLMAAVESGTAAEGRGPVFGCSIRDNNP